MRKPFIIEKIALLAIVLISFASCKKNGFPHNYPGNNPNLTYYALALGTVIDKLSTTTGNEVLNSATITNLQPEETILAIDFRPATGQLYGLGSTGRLYVINPETGAARMIGAGAITPALSGNIAGFDFNPTVDRIRVVTNTGQNLRLNPETGTVAATDLSINGVMGAMVTGVAYTNNVAGAATTTLYDIDVTTKKLYKQLPPNDGKLVEVGSLKLNVTGEGGFDIAAKDSIAIGLYKVNNIPTLFQVDLSTGEAKTLIKFEKKIPYIGIAIPTDPVAFAVDQVNNLLIFNPANTASVVSKAITGLAMGENVLGIDFRPLNGQLYALTSNSRVITLNTSSGASAPVGTLSTPLSGTQFGFDFNPTVDRIRIISNSGQNLRYNPNDPTLPVLIDGSLNPGMPAVTAAAYSNNFAGATTTMLFDIDVNTDKLYLQNPPNTGVLVEIGNLNYNVDAANGFDIGGTSGTAWAILSSGGDAKLYTINTITGAATVKANFPKLVNGFTIGLGF
ncbi:MAG: DUF4394 domain-containing protein [Ferruginibacter sp.]|nr:DUF4394 domain-containing protein [Ferruginibacter sp.]